MYIKMNCYGFGTLKMYFLGYPLFRGLSLGVVRLRGVGCARFAALWILCLLGWGWGYKHNRGYFV